MDEPSSTCIPQGQRDVSLCWALSQEPESLVLMPYFFILRLDVQGKMGWHSHYLSHVTALWDPPGLRGFTVEIAQCRVVCVWALGSDVAV